MVGYVKYNWFHKEQHKTFKEDVFNQANFYYNKDEDYYVCPMGQHINPCGQRQTKSDSGYVSVITLYRAQRCEGCYICFSAKGASLRFYSQSFFCRTIQIGRLLWYILRR